MKSSLTHEGQWQLTRINKGRCGGKREVWLFSEDKKSYVIEYGKGHRIQRATFHFCRKVDSCQQIHPVKSLPSAKNQTSFATMGTSWLDDACGKNTESASFLFKMDKKGKLFFSSSNSVNANIIYLKHIYMHKYLKILSHFFNNKAFVNNEGFVIHS